MAKLSIDVFFARIDSVLFPLIAFSGIISATAMMEMFYTNITVKAIITLLAFWMIYLVPKKPIYREDENV